MYDWRHLWTVLEWYQLQNQTIILLFLLIQKHFWAFEIKPNSRDTTPLTEWNL